MDLTAVDVRRFAGFNANNAWLRDRVAEVLGVHYAVPWPNREPASARPFRCSPLHDRLAAAGASFGSKMGWERPNYFAPVAPAPPLEYGWGRPSWQDRSDAEQRATREAVAVFDQTSFSKYSVSGRGALGALQWICAADVDLPVGGVVYTPMLNARGTYEADLTVTRTGEESFLLLSGSASTVRDGDWIRRQLPADSAVTVADVTTAYSVLGVMGPRSRDLLARLSDADLSEGAFGFATSAEISLDRATVRATRMTYVGELGWELLVPVELAAGVYDALLAAGHDLGVRPAGYYALESLRLEKGYRAFGRELTPDVTPVEAGLVFATDLSSGRDFLGRDAVAAAREALAAGRPRRRVVSFVVDDPAPMLWGGELLLHAGTPVGQVTSAAHGATVGACVGLGLVRHDRPINADLLGAGGYEVDLAGERFPVTVSLRAPLPVSR